MDYSAELRQRFSALTRARDTARGSGALLVGAAEDRSLAVWVRFEVQLKNRQIGRVSFRAFGCPHTLAAAEWLAEALEGQPIEALGTVDWQALARVIGLPREKFGKLLCIEDALAAVTAQAGTIGPAGPAMPEGPAATAAQGKEDLERWRSH